MIRILIAAIAFATTALAQPSPADKRAEEEARLKGGPAAFDGTAKAELEVKRAKTGHLLVKPTINGHAAGWFIFDTGAGVCCITVNRKKDLELTRGGEIEGAGVGGGSSMPLYRAKTFTLGPISLQDHPLMETDLSFLNQHMGEEIAGVVGYGVLSRCIAELDLATPRIAIHDPKGFELAAGKWSELLMKERIPCVKASFEDHEGVFRLDTGANGFVTMHQPAVEKWKLLDGRELKEAKLGGVGGFVKAKKGMLKWFEVGGVRQENVEATFAIEAKGNFAESGKDGNIGGDMLKPFTLVMDYAGGRIAFVKREN